MEIKILGKTQDLKTSTYVIYAQIKIEDYLKLVGENFAEFSIQRKRVKHSAYDRLRSDIISGTVLPAITLSIKPQYVEDIRQAIEKSDDKELEHLLKKENSVDILDGLQRTYILKDLQDQNTQFKENQLLLLEFWVEKDIKHLIYRLIVLNAGQKNMSMKHQIELLFFHIKEKLVEDIDGIEIYMERDGRTQKSAKKYQFNLLAQAYQCFLTQSHEIDKDNLIAKEMLKENVLDSSEADLGESFELFKKYLKIYSEIDCEVYRIYENKDSVYKNWVRDENVIQSFFSALSRFGTNTDRKERINKALSVLLEDLKSIEVLKDDQTENVLNLDKYFEIKKGVNPKKSNIGYESRRLSGISFREYFRDEGEVKLSDLWDSEAK